jgi:hypothetical protein
MGYLQELYEGLVSKRYLSAFFCCRLNMALVACTGLGIFFLHRHLDPGVVSRRESLDHGMSLLPPLSDSN